MKRFIVVFVIGFLIVSCSNRQIQNPICPQPDSWICEQSAKKGIEPETVYGWIYSASAIAAISDVVKIKEMCDFEKGIADIYVRTSPISYSSLIDEVLRQTDFMEPEKAMLIKNIINVNLLQYRHAEIISEADNIILRKGHVAFRRDMACFD